MIFTESVLNMKIFKIVSAAALMLATGLASAQTSFRIHEEFQVNIKFDGVVTFSSDYSQLIAVSGTLIDYYGNSQKVDGFYHNYIDYAPGVRGAGLIEGSPDNWDAYRLDLTWDYNHGAKVTLPQFVTAESEPGADFWYRYYANSINGSNGALVSTITPVPEPATYGMLLGGLALLGLARRRKA
nr:PEP-CTERM sorting domain-containing protein [Duganella sp. BJB1802]